MMIEHDHVHAAFPEIADLLYRRGPAIDSDQQLGLMLSDTTLDAFGTQAVALLHTQRQKQFRAPPYARNISASSAKDVTPSTS